ncbi:MAG: hypothetical protein QOG44_3214 [Acidimicrobiaceae bacterium]|jgi:hypothetical protein|nr:hypothetical protein [Acidimicrobiaceae bacterium]
MVNMKPEAVWRGGWVRSAMRIGVPTGTLFGVIQFAQSGSVGEAIFEGAFFAVFFGAAMAVIVRRSWPGAGQLESTDRVAVARIVRRGEDVEDARLAPAIIDYVGAIRRTQDRDRRYSWVLWASAGGTLVLALGASIAGSIRSAVVLWVLVVLWAGFLLLLPRKRSRMLQNASQAESGARQLLSRPPTD